MVFSSPSFLFGFLPLFFISYFLIKPRWRNTLIFFGSLFFYATGASQAALVLVVSVIGNHYLAHIMARRRGSGTGSLLLTLGVAANLVPLLFYKYLGFFTQAANDLGALVGFAPGISAPEVTLPPGISFFTFQGLSYLFDVYRRRIDPAPRLIDFGMYHTSFPQLIAGPIVRYAEIEDRIRCRPFGLDNLTPGITLFCIGLSKKVALADNMGSIADRIFALSADQLTASLAWLGTVTYTLQIYFDFSGYSDMAIGLGLMFGFVYPQNFNQPYRAQSVTEFWRRWHMTLSHWFRDYVYVPLGGNRRGLYRTYVNLFVVFLLCGLWHGAAYTFVIWGIYYGILLVIERLLRERFGVVPKGWFGWAATMLLVMIGWVIFRSDGMAHAITHLEAMAGLSAAQAPIFSVNYYLTLDKLAFLLMGILVSLVPAERLKIEIFDQPFWTHAKGLAALGLFVYSSACIATNGFNPFIYFRF